MAKDSYPASANLPQIRAVILQAFAIACELGNTRLLIDTSNHSFIMVGE